MQPRTTLQKFAVFADCLSIKRYRIQPLRNIEILHATESADDIQLVAVYPRDGEGDGSQGDASAGVSGSPRAGNTSALEWWRPGVPSSTFQMVLPRTHFVDWHCRFGDSTSPATTLSFFGHSAITSCEVPAELAELRELEVILESRNLPAWTVGPVPLRRQAEREEEEEEEEEEELEVVMCVAPVFNFTALREKEPWHLSTFLEYYRLLGVQKFFFADNDGSYAEVLSPYVAEGLVAYMPLWPSSLSGKWGALVGTYPNLMEPAWLEACVFSQRGKAKWVAAVPGINKFLVSVLLPPGPQMLQDLLRAIEERHSDAASVEGGIVYMAVYSTPGKRGGG